MFDKLKEDFASNKLNQTFTIQNLGAFNERLMCLSLDFEDDELMFRQEIWHQRIALLLKELLNKSRTQTFRISSEQIRYWLEEGQELEVVNDAKYEKINEVVEDIDNITRALKMCSTIQEVDQLDKQENSSLIELSHLVIANKQRISRGEIPKKTQQTVSPSDFLKNIRGRISEGEDACKKKDKG